MYQECLELEFTLQGILFVPQPRLELEYKGHKLRSEFQPDFICFNQVVVELKTVDALLEVHDAQVLTYLKFTGCHIGLLMNFRSTMLTKGLRRLAL